MSEQVKEVFGEDSDLSSDAEERAEPIQFDENSSEDDTPQPPNELKIVENLLKQGKRPRAKHDDMDANEEEVVDSVILEMQDAAEKDEAANLEQLPALNKLKILDKVIKFFKLAKYHELFLNMNGCEVLGKWLARLPDGAFPCPTIRARLLEVVQELPISVENLQNSDLGKSINSIFKNPAEIVALKRAARTLIDKWSRMIYDIDTQYSRADKYQLAEEEAPRKPNEVSLHRIMQKESNFNYTRVPPKGMFDFKYIPQPRVSSETRRSHVEPTGGLRKLIQSKRRAKGKTTASEMSVDGRNLNI